MHDKQVSVVITTRNEEKNIENCLESIRNQTFNSQFPIPTSHSLIEIIVVDNNSTDRTKEIAARYTEKVYNFGPERSAQRNFGVEKASGKYILYLDADMRLSERVIEECVSKCENEGCIALYIPEKIIGNGFWIMVRDFERSFYTGTCIDAIRFIRRDKFLELGGFDENLTGPEDWDFDRRIRDNGKVSSIDSPIYHNEGEFNLKKYLKKKAYYSRSFDKYIDKYSKDDKIIRKQLGFWYRYFGVFMEDGKWRKLIARPVLTLGMYWLRFMVGVRYLISNRKGRGADNV
ncbi:MAG: glycosyltransferase [Candidatus Omnitrophica bacterium]|nr:glycosyltransferase [Candidatus Omnitrophota bacterium]